MTKHSLSNLARSLSVASLIAGLGAGAQGIAHDNFDRVLHANVKDGHVNYPGIAADKTFKDYVDQLKHAATLNSKSDILLYYLNAYNALAIEGILQGLNPASFVGRHRFFKSKDWKVNGQVTTLSNIEHKILRPLGDARIHFALVCASHSCPKLRTEAFSAAKLESQLDENTRAFVNDSERNRFDKQAKRAQISEIFKWFKEDFDSSAGSVEKFLAKYVNDPELAKGLAAGEYRIEYIDYDWSLNGTPPKS